MSMKERFKVAVMWVLTVCGWAGMLRADLLQPGDTIAGGVATTTNGSGYSGGGTVVDGRTEAGTGTEWIPYSDGTWVTVDLGRAFRLQNVNLLNSWNQGGDRATSNFTFKVSATGSFAGEESTLGSGVLQPKTNGWQDLPLPAFGDMANSNLVARYLRFTAVNHYGIYGPGLAEVQASGVPDRGTGALDATNYNSGVVKAKAYTRTPYLSDTAPASWTLRRITTTSASILQSSGKSVSVTNGYPGYSTPANLVDGNNSSYVLFNDAGGRIYFTDRIEGHATIDLGSEMVVDRIDLVNGTHGDRLTSNFVVQVSNDPTFAERSNTDVWKSNFTASGQSLTNVPAQPALGRYVRVVVRTHLTGYYGGLGEMRVYGRTCTSATLATGSSQVGNSSTSGSIALGTPLSVGSCLLALDVTSSGGWSSSTLSTVEFMPPRGTVVAIR
jgi:hypothetical protein